jgi:PIN domain nuclease of toxin-antitoxin system
MRLLLDTHALLWWFSDDKRLSSTAHSAIAESSHEVYVSAASAWEIATKQRIGKLDGIPDVASWYGELSAANGFIHLPVAHAHGTRAGSYRVEHRDPFDRMLAAQGEIEQLMLVTRDPAFGGFDVATLW